MSDTSGPAFPTTPVSHGYSPGEGGEGTGAQTGMTLRDYFAAAAMQGMLAYSNVNPSYGNWVENCSPDRVAVQAYVYADAMLAARDRQPDQPVERPIEQPEFEQAEGNE